MAAEFRFSPEAEADVTEAYRWYEARSIGLGEQFLSSVEARVSSIAREPLLYSRVFGTFRRALLRRFPYAIFFEHTEERIVVFAVFHTARDPEKWRERVS